MKRKYGLGAVLKMAAWALAYACIQVGLLAETVVTFELLGDLPGGSFGSEAWAVSGDGLVVTGSSNAGEADISVPFRWENGEMTNLGIWPGALAGGADVGISYDGSIIVGNMFFYPPGILDGFIWQDGTMQMLSNSPGSSENYATTAASDDCSVIAGYRNTEEGKVWHWDKNTGEISWIERTGLDIRALTADGAVAVGVIFPEDDSPVLGFRWQKNLGIEEIMNLYANDVSGDGTRIVGSKGGEWHALLWDKGTITDFGEESGFPNAISSDGSVMGGERFGTAVMWRESDQWQRINLNNFLDSHGIQRNGYTLIQVNDLSADGSTLAGTGRHANDGDFEAFRINISESTPTTWAGYSIVDGAGNVDTAPWMGMVNVADAPWVYSYTLNNWLYIPEEHVSTSGGWGYVPR